MMADMPMNSARVLYLASAVEPIEFDGLDEMVSAAGRAARFGEKMAEAGFAANGDELPIYGDLIDFMFDASGFMAALSARKGAPVTVAINSPGGDAFMGISLYNALARYAGEVTVRIDGIAASAASLVAMAGDKIVMPENTFMMIHNPYSWAMGGHGDFERAAKHLHALETSYSGVYQSRTGLAPERVAEMMDAETYMTASEAVEAGFADEVESALRAVAFDTRLLPNLPESVSAALAEPAAADPTAGSADTSGNDAPSGDAGDGDGGGGDGSGGEGGAEPQPPAADLSAARSEGEERAMARVNEIIE
ncbi:MAG: head maturation protease, ClpP-related, partial [Pseudomonadota bacterium]